MLGRRPPSYKYTLPKNVFIVPIYAHLHGNLLGLSTYVNHHLYLNEFITRYFLHIVKINSFHIKLIKQLNKLPFLCLVCEDLWYIY